MKILITSGGTKIPIDKVRHIANMSHGTFGSRIAMSALKRGHKVHFLHAKHSKTPFSLNIDAFRDHNIIDLRDRLDEIIDSSENYKDRYSQSLYETFEDYYQSLESLILANRYDAVILAAAVSDYGVENPVNAKIRTAENMSIQLKPLPKIISKIKEWDNNIKLVGFKLLVNSEEEELLNEAKKSIQNNKCDMVIANDLRDIFNDEHQIFIVKPNSIKKYSTDIEDNLYLARQVIKSLEKL